MRLTSFFTAPTFFPLAQLENPSLTLTHMIRSLGVGNLYRHSPPKNGEIALWSNTRVVSGARSHEAQRAEETARHQGRSQLGGQKIWTINTGGLSDFFGHYQGINPRNVKSKIR